MALQKLESTDAFVVRDLDNEAPAIGIVRSAPKILQGGAKELARSQTYQLAILEMQYQGASGGVNAEEDDRDQAMENFCTELLPAVESGSLMLDPAKGITTDQLGPLAAADNRSDVRLRDIDGISNAAHLAGVGAVAAAGAVRSLDGATIAIEGFDEIGVGIARAAAAAGAAVISVSTGAGTALAVERFEIDELTVRLAEHGDDLIAVLTEEVHPFWRVIAVEADILFVGSKAGFIDHKNAENITTSLVVPTGPIPYTTKGALTMQRNGITVLPDFITTAGGLLAGFPPTEDQTALEAAVSERVASLTESVLGTDAGPILQACYAAETFLASWREQLPFGRPFA